MARKFTCYVLRFVTFDREHREYYGETEMVRSQDQDEACQVRKKYHLLKPLGCMARGVPESFEIWPLGRPLSEENVLLQEAILTARALEDDSSARGACYSCGQHLGSFLRNSAHQVFRVCRNLEGQAARDALKRYVSKLDSSHPLSKHVAGAPYKDADPKKITLPTKFAKSRSGVQGNLTRGRQLRKGEYEHGDATHRRLKRGPDPSAVVQAEDARRPVARASGTKKRPAAVLRRPAAVLKRPTTRAP
jgi:hypothetical protein